MERKFEEIEGLYVTVDRVAYMPSLELDSDKRFAFAYFITIHNESHETVTIRGRKWVVSEKESPLRGETIVVEGDGVVGQFPELKPGTRFAYNSYHAVYGESDAVGAFFGVAKDGRWIVVRIPRFGMSPPELL